jgi:hypothetical protein
VLPSWVSVTVGVRQSPSQSFANQRPFCKKFQLPERQHKSRTQDPSSCVSAHLPLFYVWRATKWHAIGKQLIISRVPIYQSDASIEYLLLVSCLGSLALGMEMDHPSRNANMKWSFPSISVLVHQPLYFIGKMPSASPSRELFFSGICCAMWCSGFYSCLKKSTVS